MSDNNNLISLNCPNCNAPLKCEKTSMKAVCEHCGASVLIKDFVTKKRLDNGDKLESCIKMSQHAIETGDWKSAYKYYQTICELDFSQENTAILSVLRYLSGNMPFDTSIIQNCSTLEISVELFWLVRMKEYTKACESQELSAAFNIKDKKKRNNKVAEVSSRYRLAKKAIKKRLKAVKPLKCSCGNIVQYRDNCCSGCGKQTATLKKEKTFKIVAWISLVVAIALGGVAAGQIYYGADDSLAVAIVFTLIALAVFLYSANKVLKERIINFFTSKKPFSGKDEPLNKILLPVTAVFPIVLMCLLGILMEPTSEKEPVTNNRRVEIQDISSESVEATEVINYSLDSTYEFEGVIVPVSSKWEFLSQVTSFYCSDDSGVLSLKSMKFESYEKLNYALEVENELCDNNLILDSKLSNDSYSVYKYENIDEIGYMKKYVVTYNWNYYQFMLLVDEEDANNCYMYNNSDEIIKSIQFTEPLITEATEPPTKLSTEAPTEEITEAPTEAPTEEQTEAVVKETEPVEEIVQEEQAVEETEDPDSQITVYKTATGEKYHYENPCGSGTYYETTLAEAKRIGLGPCEKCVLH